MFVTELASISAKLGKMNDVHHAYIEPLTNLAKKLFSELEVPLVAHIDRLDGVREVITAVDALGVDDDPPFAEMAKLRKSSAGMDLKNYLDEHRMVGSIGCVMQVSCLRRMDGLLGLRSPSAGLGPVC